MTSKAMTSLIVSYPHLEVCWHLLRLLQPLLEDWFDCQTQDCWVWQSPLLLVQLGLHSNQIQLLILLIGQHFNSSLQKVAVSSVIGLSKHCSRIQSSDSLFCSSLQKAEGESPFCGKAMAALSAALLEEGILRPALRLRGSCVQSLRWPPLAS